VLQIEERLKSNEELADLFQKRFETASKTVLELKIGVQSMFQKFGCNTPAVRELIGDSGVSEQNLLQCMSIIEQRINEVLRVYIGSLQRSGQDTEHLKVPLGQAALPHDSMHVVIQPPSTNDEEYEDLDMQDGDEDAEPKPMGQEQLMAKVQGTLKKKGTTAIFRVPEHSKRSKPVNAPRSATARS
jgi:coiled-coil domain-containing protein 63/114